MSICESSNVQTTFSIKVIVNKAGALQVHLVWRVPSSKHEDTVLNHPARSVSTWRSASQHLPSSTAPPAREILYHLHDGLSRFRIAFRSPSSRPCHLPSKTDFIPDAVAGEVRCRSKSCAKYFTKLHMMSFMLASREVCESTLELEAGQVQLGFVSWTDRTGSEVVISPHYQET